MRMERGCAQTHNPFDFSYVKYLCDKTVISGLIYGFDLVNIQ